MPHHTVLVVGRRPIFTPGVDRASIGDVVRWHLGRNDLQNWAVHAVQDLGNNDPGDEIDIGFGDDESGWSYPETQCFPKYTWRSRGASRAWHRHNPTGQRLADFGVALVDDHAGLRVEASPEAERFAKDEEVTLTVTRVQRTALDIHAATSSLSLISAAIAEATQSVKLAKTTSTSSIPGA